MRTTTLTRLMAVPALCLLGLAAPTLAHAENAPRDYSVALDSLNNSGAKGVAMIEFNAAGDMTVRIKATGLVPGQPHAQHLHGSSDLTKDFHCPTMAADANGDGILSTAEGVPDYGDIFISLTTKGDSTKKSALAVTRFPAADKSGRVDYERTFPKAELPAGTETAIKNLHIVQHGIDPNGNGKYDFRIGKSELDPKLPQEATAPASCGMVAGSHVKMVPAGGVETGTGDTSGVESVPLFLLGGGLLTGAGVLAAGARRRRTTAS